MAPSCRWHIHPTPQVVFQATAAAMAETARRAIAERGVFSVVLTGGSTARGVYPLLRDLDTDWSAWQIYWGDERCLPPGDAERNDHLARELWLDRVPIPAASLHPIPAELDATEAARRYAALIANLPAFDLVLLGLGEDGHVASLFPGHDWGAAEDGPAALAVVDAPKPPPQRVSLSAWRLSRALHVLVVATGAGKAAAVSAWRRGAPLPAAAIAPPAGVDVLLDRACLPAPEDR
jgi:6-phosphogluconolactonase